MLDGVRDIPGEMLDHDTRIAREEARRAAVAELPKMAMDDPDLDEAWGLSRKARTAGAP